MVSLALLLMGALFCWEGYKGFTPTGIRIGIFKANSEPIAGPKGRTIGGFLIALGVLFVFLAFYLGYKFSEAFDAVLGR